MLSLTGDRGSDEENRAVKVDTEEYRCFSRVKCVVIHDLLTKEQKLVVIFKKGPFNGKCQSCKLCPTGKATLVSLNFSGQYNK